MNIDFTKQSGTSTSHSIPKWLDSVFSAVKKSESMQKKASVTQDELFPKQEEETFNQKDIEQILLANDRLSRIEKEANKTDEVFVSRVDPIVRPHSTVAREKIAAHWAGDTVEDILKAEGDVVNDGDKVREEEEKKFEAEASGTAAQITKENKPRNSIFETVESGKKEATTKKVVVKKASDDKEDKKKEDKKKEDKKKDEEDDEKKDKKEEKDENVKEAGKMPAAALEALQKSQGKGKKDDKDDKKDDDEEEKDEKKDKKDKEDDEDKEASNQDLETKLAVRSYRRHEVLRKFAEKVESGKTSKKVVKYPDNWYDEIVGEKTNIGNVREASAEGVEKEAAAEVGLGFDEDPQASGEYGQGGDFKVADVFDQNAGETIKDAVEKEPMMSGDEESYPKEYGTTHKASTQTLKKEAHYNNRTMGMDDDGPTAPAGDADPRDTTEASWWEAQVAKSKNFLAKEYQILGDGKKITHMDAIPLFKDKSTKSAFLADRQIRREAMVVEAAKKSTDKSVKSYYADAYGDSGYAADMVKDYQPGQVVSKQKSKKATLQERADFRSKLAGIETSLVKTASDEEIEKEAGIPVAGAAALIGVATKIGPAILKLLANPKFQMILAGLPALLSAAKSGNDNAIKAEIGKLPADQQNQIVEGLKAGGAIQAQAPAAGVAPATAASNLEMRKLARKELIASTYGEPVKEPNSDKIGDPDWKADDLTRNAIVDSPQDEIIKQLEQAISNVREATKKKK